MVAPPKQTKAEKATRAEIALGHIHGAVAKEVDRITDPKFIKKARREGLPVVNRILDVREKVGKLQESLLEEALFSSIQLITRVKQKALTGVMEWLEEFCQDKEKLKELSPAQAKTLLSIAFTADQMGRLELGKSTSNVAIAHNSSNPAETSRLQQAVDKLKEIDPVFDYSNVEVVAIPAQQLLPDNNELPVRTLPEGESSGEKATGGGLQLDSGGACGDDGLPLPSDKQ